MEVYDTFKKKSIKIEHVSTFLKEEGLYNTKNRNTFCHFVKRTKFCFHRFIKQEFKHKVFKVFCLQSGEEYECVSSNGFLKQIGEEETKLKIHELNRMRFGTRTTIPFGGLLYCLSEKKDKISNRMLCSQTYAGIEVCDKAKQNVKLQRRLGNCLRDRIRHAVLLKSDSSFNLIGCPVEFVMGWLESKFQEGMSWENYGRPDGDHFSGWHIDHVKPCSSFDLSDPEEQKKCFHYTNLQPLWAIDNMKKGNRYT